MDAQAAPPAAGQSTGALGRLCALARSNLRAVAAGLLTATGLAGAGAQAASLYSPSLDGAPPALGVLLSSLVASFALQAAWAQWLATKPALPLPAGRLPAGCRLWGTRLAGVCVALLFVGYLVGYRADGALWCAPLAAAIALQSYALGAWTRRDAAAQKQKQQPADDDGGGAGGSIEMHDSSRGAALLLDDAEGGGGDGAAHGDDVADAAGVATAPSPAAAAVAAAAARLTCAPRSAPLALHAAHACAAALWGVSLLFLLGLLGGCGTWAVGWRRYPPRGAFYDVPLPGGGVQQLHAWCAGPPASTSPGGPPTVWIEVGGGGHSSTDTLGLQDALVAAGWRVCTHDPPGTAWSPLSPDVAPASLPNAALTAGLMDAMGEGPGPYALVGTMDDGAARIAQFALAHPARVAALVPMQYGVNEFLVSRVYYGWDDAATAAAATAALRARIAMGDVIRFLAVPWGLMPLFLSDDASFVPAGVQPECHFLNLEQEGQWDMQVRVLAAQAADPGGTVLAPDVWATAAAAAAAGGGPGALAPGIRVLALDNPADDPCGDAGVAPDSDACRLLLFGRALNSGFMRNMSAAATPAGSGLYRACEGGRAACADWLGGGSTVPWVAAAIDAFLRAGGNVTTNESRA